MKRRRRVKRDPRSLLELRRMAYKARRSIGMREVLHDALLETFPVEYEEAIRHAHQEAKTKDDFAAREKFIVFLPSRLKRQIYTRRKHPSDMLFLVRDNVTVGEEDTTTRALEERMNRTSGFGSLPNIPSFRSAIIVYRTRGYL